MTKTTGRQRQRKVGRKRKRSGERAVRLAISLPPDQARRAQAAVRRGEAESVSAYVAAALGRMEEETDLVALAAEMTAEQGEPTPEDEAWARRVLGLLDA